MICERSGSVVARGSDIVLVNPGSVGQSRERRVVAALRGGRPVDRAERPSRDPL